MRAGLAICLFWLAGVAACQQEAPNPTPADAAAAKVLAEITQKFAAEGIVLDAKAATVTLKAVMNEPPDPIEYVLIHRRGKRHEAMFWTQCKPSMLHAALLMIGLQPGSNAKAEEIQPPPSIEEIEKGAETVRVVPPKGEPFWMTVRWQTPEGKTVEYCIEDLLLDLSTEKPVVDCSWVYIGGRMAPLYRNEPEVFVADFEGNLISSCYMSPDNHLGTIVHKVGRDQNNWWLTNKVPKAETEVQFVFHKRQPKLHQQREERLRREAAEEAEAARKKAVDGGGTPAATPGEGAGKTGK
jgi:hypothetical protein